jgi:hypothetical protein
MSPQERARYAQQRELERDLPDAFRLYFAQRCHHVIEGEVAEQQHRPCAARQPGVKGHEGLISVWKTRLCALAVN